MVSSNTGCINTTRCVAVSKQLLNLLGKLTGIGLTSPKWRGLEGEYVVEHRGSGIRRQLGHGPRRHTDGGRVEADELEAGAGLRTPTCPRR